MLEVQGFVVLASTERGLVTRVLSEVTMPIFTYDPN